MLPYLYNWKKDTPVYTEVKTTLNYHDPHYYKTTIFFIEHFKNIFLQMLNELPGLNPKDESQSALDDVDSSVNEFLHSYKTSTTDIDDLQQKNILYKSLVREDFDIYKVFDKDAKLDLLVKNLKKLSKCASNYFLHHDQIL